MAEHRTRNDEAPATIFSRVPEKERAKANPLETDADAPAAGKKLYAQHCAECHGVDGAGSGRGPALSNAALSQATPGELYWVLSNGVVRRGMPSWAKLPAAQRWQIVVYLKNSAR